MADYGVTDLDRELAGVVDQLALIIDRGSKSTSESGPEYWAEELIPPMTEDADEIVANTMIGNGDNRDHKGSEAGFTLWHGMTGYRVTVSKLCRP